jgi:hypothetical protein
MPQLSNPTSQAQSATGTPGVTAPDQNQTPAFPDQNGMEGGDDGEAGDGLDVMEGMDLDIPDLPDMPDDGEEQATAVDDWVMVDDGTAGGDSSQPDLAQADPTAEETAQPLITTDAPEPSEPAPPADELATSTADATAPAADPTPATSNTTPGLFDTGADFADDFTNMDSAGDALADFTTAGDDGGDDGLDDLGLDDSAFGEAMHGMDDHVGNEGGEGGTAEGS